MGDLLEKIRTVPLKYLNQFEILLHPLSDLPLFHPCLQLFSYTSQPTRGAYEGFICAVSGTGDRPLINYLAPVKDLIESKAFAPFYFHRS